MGSLSAYSPLLLPVLHPSIRQFIMVAWMPHHPTTFSRDLLQTQTTPIRLLHLRQRQRHFPKLVSDLRDVAYSRWLKLRHRGNQPVVRSPLPADPSARLQSHRPMIALTTSFPVTRNRTPNQTSPKTTSQPGNANVRPPIVAQVPARSAPTPPSLSPLEQIPSRRERASRVQNKLL